MSARDREIWEARLRGETVAELGERFNLLREKINQICTRERALDQRRAEEEKEQK